MKIRKQSNEAMERLAARLEGQRIAMLTLVEDGALASRPLSALEMDDQGAFWFFTSRHVMQPLVGDGAAPTWPSAMKDGRPMCLSSAARRWSTTPG